MVQQVGTVLARGLLPVLLLFAARPLLAAPIAIDFTDNAFAGAAGAGSFTTTILGITVRLDALESGATLTRPNSDPDAFRDGIGIDSSYEDDEFGGPRAVGHHSDRAAELALAQDPPHGPVLRGQPALPGARGGLAALGVCLWRRKARQSP
jgi:hypothetical protein